MPATGNQAFENASLRTPPAKMKHLRIKLVGELDDLPYRHAQRLRFEPITCFQIVEITLLHDENGRSTLLRDRSQSSNTYVKASALPAGARAIVRNEFL